jgi:hypothetical protein
MGPSDHLRNAAGLIEQRQHIYGSNYNRIGPMISALFPEGVQLKTADDLGRFHILALMCAKLGRYAWNFSAGGHADSLSDIAAYAAILQNLDDNAAASSGSLPR